VINWIFVDVFELIQAITIQDGQRKSDDFVRMRVSARQRVLNTKWNPKNNRDGKLSFLFLTTSVPGAGR
jgi:hypothetical protein